MSRIGTTLVTGGAGFIGSHLVKSLLDEGRVVIAVDNFQRGNLQNYSDLNINIECLNLDLTNSELVNELFSEHKFESVFHLAARIGNIEYLHMNSNTELNTLNTNLLIDSNVIKACINYDIEKFVYSSSISVYPIDLQEKIGSVFSEKDLTYVNPEGGYGWAKYIGEQQLSWLPNSKVGIARIFNVYGELKPIGDTAHVISRFIKNLLFNKDEFCVWGSGEQTRCFLYISDCIDALIKLEKKAANPPLIVNIGSDVPITINKLAEKIISILKLDYQLKHDPSKPVGPLSRTANIQKAKQCLNWEPKISIEEGIERTAIWIRKRIKNNPELFL